MNSLIHKSAISLGALGAALLFVILTIIISISSTTHADNGQVSQTGRLITIHDRSVEKVIVSQAATIADALKEANIIIDSKDLVEPNLAEKLVASDYQVNIYRARPVIVIDGNTRTKIVTAYQTAAQIANEAGIKLYDEDKVTLARTDDFVAEGVGLKLVIDRAVLFSFTLYGKAMASRTHGKTVGEMLAEKGVNLTTNDKVSPDKSAFLTDGLAVRVWREGKQTITIDEAINFETDKVESADQSAGYREVKVIGEQGSRSVSYEITIQDGLEVGRIEIASLVTKQPKKQIELVGVKGQYTTPIENETIVWDYLINKGFSRIQTAGIMGNLKQEHHFQTSGDGLAQWTGGRKADLYSRAYPNNIYTQLDFLMDELNGKYDWVRDEIKSATSLTDTVRIFQNKFERCGVCMENNRINYAQGILGSH
jgi:uncharacterized protein YabE (DUF348 family)